MDLMPLDTGPKLNLTLLRLGLGPVHLVQWSDPLYLDGQNGNSQICGEYYNDKIVR